jgi:hypothetical protein
MNIFIIQQKEINYIPWTGFPTGFKILMGQWLDYIIYIMKLSECISPEKIVKKWIG